MEIMKEVMWGVLLVLLCAVAHTTEVSVQESLGNRILEVENRLLQQQSTIDEMQSTIDELLCNYLQLPGDCQEAYELGFRDAGLHTAKLENGQLVNLLCDNDDQYQWTIIQQRKQGDVLFNRSYVEYQEGFGNVGAETDFWLGLDAIHQISSVGPSTLRVELRDWEGETGYAEYSTFSVGSVEEEYILNLAGYSGDAGDSLQYHNRQGFTTYDHDVDGRSSSNCATSHGGNGGWWYRTCHYSNLNGRYISPPQHNVTSFQGINWYHWKYTNRYSYKSSQMMIRRSTP